MTIKIIEGVISQTETDTYRTELFEALEAGYTVIAHAVYDIAGVTYERWCLKSPNQEQPVQAVQVRAIVSIERDQTYSKSTEQYFDFWRCVLDTGKRVNIFDHPDESRNTFKAAQAKGWYKPLKDMDQDIAYGQDVPIPCIVSFDGEWYSLVDIIEAENHAVMTLDNFRAIEQRFRDISEIDETAEIPDLPFPALDFDEPLYSECSMCGKERVLNSQGRCSQCQTVWDS